MDFLRDMAMNNDELIFKQKEPNEATLAHKSHPDCVMNLHYEGDNYIINFETIETCYNNEHIIIYFYLLKCLHILTNEDANTLELGKPINLVNRPCFKIHEDIFLEFMIMLNSSNYYQINHQLFNYIQCYETDDKNIKKYIFNFFKNDEDSYYTPIIDFYSTKKDILNILITMIKNVIKHQKCKEFFKPRPNYIVTPKGINLQQYFKTMKIHEHLDNISVILENIDMDLIYDNEYKFNTEKELFMKYPLEYHILYESIINFNIFNLKQIQITSKEVNELTDSSFSVYEVEYNDKASNDIIEQHKFEKHNLGFHGSGILNWYSIFYNGLKSSKTVGVANGAAYGLGIYISTQSSYSYGYSTKNGDTYSIMGVFQVIGGLDKHKKTPTIYVVNDEKIVYLKYLIVFKKRKIAWTYFDYFDKFFVKNHNEEMITKNKKIEQRGIKRIMKEIKELQKYNDMEESTQLTNEYGLHMNFTFDIDNMYLWNIQILRKNFYDADKSEKDQCGLYQDMIHRHIETIEFEITLPSNYPFEPPFIRILQPRLQFRTGHVTMGGSICMELLTKGSWVCSMSVDKIMMMITQNLISGNARLDPTNWNKPYGMGEAKEAYDRMLRNHPEWMKPKK